MPELCSIKCNVQSDMLLIEECVTRMHITSCLGICRCVCVCEAYGDQRRESEFRLHLDVSADHWCAEELVIFYECSHTCIVGPILSQHKVQRYIDIEKSNFSPSPHTRLLAKRWTWNVYFVFIAIFWYSLCQW